MPFPYLPFESPNGSQPRDNQSEYCRYYEIAGITIQVESDLPITDTTFQPKFKHFEITTPGDDVVSIYHRFELPNIDGRYVGEEVYRKPPWVIYHNDSSWVYECIAANGDGKPSQISVFNNDHTQGRIYHSGHNKEHFLDGGFHSLTLLPTDQILIARVLADRNACYLHSVGVVLKGKGLLFVGHSSAGKSTLSKLLGGRVTILCDDRNIVRRWQDGFRVHGTWSHGEVPIVSGESAPLEGIFFLRKSLNNRITPVLDRHVIVKNLLSMIIKPLVTTEWWEKELTLIEQISREVPCYEVEFDKSGKIVDSIVALTEKQI